MMAYRTMTKEDIPAGLGLCREFRWNQVARDWELFLTLGPGDCRVATQDDRTVGTVRTIRYAGAFSWIGMVLVDPAQQRRGIGLQLLKEALLILQDQPTVKLDATPRRKRGLPEIEFCQKNIASAVW